MIELITSFIGSETNNERLHPGTYADGDLPAGLADWLVEHGFAHRLEAVKTKAAGTLKNERVVTKQVSWDVEPDQVVTQSEVSPASPELTIEDDIDPLHEFTKAELLEIAEEHGLELSDRMTKADIIAAIEGEG